MAQEEEVERPYWVPTEFEAQYGDHIPQGMASAKEQLARKAQFVIFVDILGFADLVEGDEQEHLRWMAGLSSLRASMRDRPPSRLTSLFDNFHNAVEKTLQQTRNLNLITPVAWRPPGIVFSDSAFITISPLNMALDVAGRLMRELIASRVPARIGIGFGGFLASRFSTETRRGKTHHVSEFFGTAVVRAHRAENSGIVGMRVLLHPSVTDQIAAANDVSASIVLQLPTPGKSGVTHELNYVQLNFAGTLEARVVEMRAQASDNFHSYYDETLAAMQRMKAALEEEAP